MSEAEADISIHALRKESDQGGESLSYARVISIHALRKESDAMVRQSRPQSLDFNPRSP